MTHIDDEELVVMVFDGTGGDAALASHLETCPECRARLAALRQDLHSMSTADDVPVRGDEYGSQVWARIEPRIKPIPASRWLDRVWEALTFPRLALAGGVAALVVAAFVAGRVTQPIEPPQVATARPQAPNAQVRERVLLIAVGDHLERSRMVLAEIVNRPGTAGADLEPERQVADDLVATNRLYRRTALESGDQAMAASLEELERTLVEIANSPGNASEASVQRLRDRINSQGLIFKVTVLGGQVRQRQLDVVPSAPARPRSSL